MPRVEIPLIGPSYMNREKPLSAQVAKNMWPEINPEARNQVCLHNVAGIRTFATLSGKDRGMHDFNNLMYAVSGETLYSIDAEGTNFALGTIPGSDRVVMANDTLQLIIVTGATPYKYTVAGGVEAITDPDLVNPTTVAYLNQKFIFDQNAGVFGEFVVSSIDPELSVDALDFAQAESHPDDIISIQAFRQLAYFYGSHSVEPWQDIGKGNPPLARINSGVQPYGLAGLHAITKTDEFMYFLDTKRIPRRSNGLSFLNIGTPALGVEFAKYTKIDDCIAFDFVQDNQQFVAFTFPTANRTWVFHEPSGSWFQLVSGIGNDRHRASSMIHMYGLNYCADHTNGLIYEYSLDIFSDNGDPIIKQRDTATIHGGLFDVPGAKLFYDEVEFIIVAGETEVAGTGLGPQPAVGTIGVCGTADDLTQGTQLLGTTTMHNAQGLDEEVIEQVDPFEDGVSFDDTSVVSFTFAFIRENAPDAGYTCPITCVYDVTNIRNVFIIYLDSNGYIQIEGKDNSGTELLNVTITNNGSSFADSKNHMIAGVIDISDTNRREIYLKSSANPTAFNIGESSSYVTWNTYINGIIPLADTAPPDSESDPGLKYYFGQGFDLLGSGIVQWGALSVYQGAGWDVGIDALCYLTLDDACTLVPSSVWDANGNLTDPQKWEGWYINQPQVFYTTSFWRNTGKTEPATSGANDMELQLNRGYGTGARVQEQRIDENIIDIGIGSTLEADHTTSTPSLPDAPDPDSQIEIVAPFWENTGNWIDLSKLTNTTFEVMFGVAIENADFNKVVVVNKAALVNTSDSGNRLQIQDTIDCSNAAMYITDSSGNVVHTMLYENEPTGRSVLVPTGANYYVVISSDTGNAKIKKWDTTQISTVGSVSWESFFGVPFSLGRTIYDETNIIPASGTSIAFTVPTTSSAFGLSFAIIENTSITTSSTGSVNQTVGDFTATPTFTWGNGVGIRGGINLAGQDIDLIPGETYFFNIRNNSPTDLNFIRIQVLLVAQ